MPEFPILRKWQGKQRKRGSRFRVTAAVVTLTGALTGGAELSGAGSAWAAVTRSHVTVSIAALSGRHASPGHHRRSGGTGKRRHRAQTRHHAGTRHHAEGRQQAEGRGHIRARHHAQDTHRHHPAGHAHHGRRTRGPLSPAQLARRGRWKLEIPGIGVATRLLVLGHPHGNALPVPSPAQARNAAWYSFSAVPGRPGNSVVVGHVDTYTGPAVFYNLYRLRHGDPVYVSTGGRRMRFAVRRVTEVPKALFPVRQVFGPATKPQLWIITCGGDFDSATHHYLDNIIVSAYYQPTRRHKLH